MLAPPGQVSNLLPIGCLVIVYDQAYHCCDVCKLNDGVGVIPGHPVMGEQGEHEGTDHAPLRGSSVQRGRCVATYPHHLGAAEKV